jgi:prolyl-tRNA synthetase
MVVVARRDAGTKETVAMARVAAQVAETLDAVHGALYAEAVEMRRQQTVVADDIASAEEAARTGFAVLPLSLLGGDGENRLNEAGASVRCIQTADGGLPDPVGSDDAAAGLIAVVARAY